MSVADRILKNFALFVDGRGYAGKAEEFSPPKLSLQLDEFRAGGMNAPVSIEMGMEKLESSWKMASNEPDMIALWGNGKDVPIVARGVVQNLDGSVEPVVITQRGPITSLEPEAMKPGERGGTTYTQMPTYYKYEQNGETLIEIDILNHKRVIRGVDVLAEQRKAMGI